MDFSKLKYKPVFLAPLAGITDMAFREICKENGAEITVSEMISAKGIWYKDKKTASLMEFHDSQRPFGIQLFGSEPEIMAYAAQKAEEYSPDFIDINMGCPMPKIVQNGDGSALMGSPTVAGKIVEAIKKSVSLPVTVKIRKGRNENSVNAVEVAEILQESGADLITVHGRTAVQLYSGTADREIIARVKAAVKIPVIGNGDIFSPADAAEMIALTGCDGVMIGRGALGNPFVFSRTREYLDSGTFTPFPDDKAKLMTAVKQLDLACFYKGERTAVPEMRKHIAWYLKGMQSSAKLKTAIFTTQSKSDIIDLINCYISDNY